MEIQPPVSDVEITTLRYSEVELKAFVERFHVVFRAAADDEVAFA